MKQSCQSIGTNDDENQIPPNPPLAKGGRGDFQKKLEILEERKGHILKENSRDSSILCNTDSLPGAMSQRACVYSGARVVLNPISDAVHLVHGPVGCARYTWDIRGSLSSGDKRYKTSFSTDLKEQDVIFGGEDRLTHSIIDIAQRYRPPAIFVYATCIVGIIGDDMRAICKRLEKMIDIPLIPVQSEGFRGNKSAGYRAACDAILELLKRKSSPLARSPLSVNILGEFNVAGDLWRIRPYLYEIGIKRVISVTGDSRVSDIIDARDSALNLVQCSGSMNYLAKRMKEEFGIPFSRASLFGHKDISKALIDVADFFGDVVMKRKAEAIIREKEKEITPILDYYRSRLRGRRVAIYMGGAAKALSLIRTFKELEMDVVIVGTQTGTREDYTEIKDELSDSAIIIDDANPLELIGLIKEKRVDIMVSGVKERYLAYKMGIAFCDYNHERRVFFEGFEGLINFAREIYASINSPVWRYRDSMI